MLDDIIQSFSIYYGIDWLAMLLGMTGFYLITNRNYWGFACSIVGCCCGLSVATISGQYGFITYNIILIIMMMRGIIMWRREAVNLQAAE